jgi:tellurite methyltransferase
VSEPAAPSPWFVRHADHLREAAQLGPVLDLACGRGRHTLAAAALGARAIGMDRDPAVLKTLLRDARAQTLPVPPLAVRADLEAGDCLPVRPSSCGALLVFRYLHRPQVPNLAALLRPGGLLLYETFTQDQRNLGYGPTNPAFLLAPNELRELFGELTALAYEETRTKGARPEALARLAARRNAPAARS